MSQDREAYAAGTENTSGTPRRVLTPMQRAAFRLLGGLGEMLERGEPGRTRSAEERVAEQHTAALLGLAGDAIAHGYEAELVAVVRAWRLEREG